MIKVSVVIPTYNRPHLIKRTLNSVLKQTFQDFEIIIVDDGTKERAEDVVKSYNDPRIKYIKHEINKGGGAARNTGIKNAVGEYVAFLDDDDEWLPEKLEMQVKALDDADREVGFCFTAITQILDNEERSTNIDEGEIDYYEKSLVTFKKVLTSALLVRKSVFEKVGYFDESLPSHQEAELIIRIAKEHKAFGINKPLVKMLSDSSHDHIGSILTKRIAGCELLLNKHFAEYMIRPKILARHYFQLGVWCRDNKNNSKASQYFFKAFKNDFKLLYLLHGLSMSFNGIMYDLIKK